MIFVLCYLLVAGKKKDDSLSSKSSDSNSDEVTAANKNNVTGECLEGYMKNLNGFCAPVLVKPVDIVPVPA